MFPCHYDTTCKIILSPCLGTLGGGHRTTCSGLYSLWQQQGEQTASDGISHLAGAQTQGTKDFGGGYFIGILQPSTHQNLIVTYILVQDIKLHS